MWTEAWIMRRNAELDRQDEREKPKMNVELGSSTFDAEAIIMLRHKDETLRIVVEGGKPDVQATFLRLTDRIKSEQRIRELESDGYEFLCLILPDGRTKYAIRHELSSNQAYLDAAEKIADMVDRAAAKAVKDTNKDAN
jgi:hypothetical protein